MFFIHPNIGYITLCDIYLLYILKYLEGALLYKTDLTAVCNKLLNRSLQFQNFD